VRILVFTLTFVLLSGCSYQKLNSMMLNFQGGLSSDTLDAECDDAFNYDNSDSPCNLYGWQRFVHQSLKQTKEAHDQALFELGNSLGDTYKRLILLSQPHEPLNVRIEATEAILNVGKANTNSFGQFFYIIATYNEQNIAHQKEALYAENKLNKLAQKNTRLKKELEKTQAKIQAIMDIEKTLNTN